MNNDLKQYQNRHYTYIFVRQDISPEQQLVQAAHVALVLGSKLKPDQVKNLYFAVIGIPNLKGFCSVMKQLGKLNIDFTTFYEDDLGDEMTAIATYPIHHKDRGELLEYKKLSLQLQNNQL